MVLKFGADSLRLYEMFMGPLEDAKPWQPDGIIGTHRFLNRLWILAMAYKTEKRRRGFRLKEVAQIPSPEIEKLMHQTIKKVSGDIQGLRLNTVISAFMVALNGLEKEFIASPLSLHEPLLTFAKLLFPFAPHVSQELWQKLGNKTLLDAEIWPEWDEKLVKEENYDLVIQVNGKLRATAKAAMGIDEEEAKKLALSLEVTRKWVDAKKIKKTVFVKDRLINFIV
jgi:leucyl-tRNA synthetase